MQKRFDEAIAEAKRARELDPLSLGTSVAERLFDARRFDEAVTELKYLHSFEPNNANTHFQLGCVYLGKGLYEESMASFQKSFILDDDPVAKGYIALSQAKLGHRAEAVKQLEWLKHEASRRYVPSIAFAFTYIALNEKNEAFVWLEKDVEDRTNYASSYGLTPCLTSYAPTHDLERC